MSNEIAVPDYLKDMMDSGQVEDTTKSMDVATSSVPRLSTKGKLFRFKMPGEDEVKAGQEINVVILGMNPPTGLAHTFYRDGYTPDSSDPPDCSSMDGVRPDSWIANPECEMCAKCPQQVWGSATSMNGKKAKACKDSKHLYIARTEDFKKDPENCPVYIMSVTVNSLKAFSAFGKELAAKGFPGPQFVVTHISMDEEASVPKLEFKILGPLNEKLGKISHARNTAKDWETASAPAIENQSESKRSLPDHTDEPVKESSDNVIEGEVEADSADDLIEQW